MLRGNELTIGSFGYGASALGNLYRSLSDDVSHSIVDAAWDGGVRYFDTAPHYGLGLSESRLGRALRNRPRNQYVLSTKVGRILEPNPHGAGTRDDEGFDVEATTRRRWDFSADGARRSLDDSLVRLGQDHIDVLYLHDPELHLKQAIEGAVPALVELRNQGVISAIGVGSKDTTAITALIETGAMDLAMVAGRYTLLEQPALMDVIPAASRYGTQVVAVGVFNSGLLARTVPDPNGMYDYGPVPKSVYERAVALANACMERGVLLPHAAVQFALRHPLVVNVTFGAGKPSHLTESLDFASRPLPETFWNALETSGLIPMTETLQS